MTSSPSKPNSAVGDYVMEHAGEAERLERKTDDAKSEEQLRLVGIREGMRALDLGAGSGAVTRVMARLVGPSGRATAFDGSKERLDHGRTLAADVPNLDFVQGDIYAPGLPAGVFDLVWSRFVFSYLAEPARAVAAITPLLRVGGVLALADIDGNGLFHFPMSEKLAGGLAKLERAFAGRFDPLVGRKLFHFVRSAGLEQIRVHVLPYHLYPGTAPDEAVENWREKLSTIRPIAERAFGSATDYEAFVEAFLGHLRDPETYTYSTLHIAVGRRVRE